MVGCEGAERGHGRAVVAVLGVVQAVRYTLAAVVLMVVLQATGRAVPRPRGREWAWVSGVALSGLVLFNVGVVRGVAHAEPAVIGVAVAVAAVPVLLALVGPLLGRTPSSPSVVVAAMVVTLGAVMVTGGGRTDAAGLGYALLTLVSEAGFTLLAVPVLRRLGPHGVSLHAVWMAAIALWALSLATDGPGAALTLRTASEPGRVARRRGRRRGRRPRGARTLGRCSQPPSCTTGPPGPRHRSGGS